VNYIPDFAQMRSCRRLADSGRHSCCTGPANSINTYYDPVNTAGLYKLNAVDHSRESAWFQRTLVEAIK
jgi:hypothetical protein